MPSKSLPRVRLTKICGDNNLSDYVPDKFWAEGYMYDEPCVCYPFIIGNLTASSDMVDPEAEFETPKITKIFNTTNGFLLVADQELWSMIFL
jgi:hypothetical protein